MMLGIWEILFSGASTMYKIQQILLFALASLIVLFLALPFHEFSHAFIANKLGDPTARYQGRMKLNPLVHLDPWGSALILIFGFGYAKPVPINPRNFKNPKRGMALSALAGPVANLILTVIALILFNVICVIAAPGVKYPFAIPPYVRGATVVNVILQVVSYVININVCLAVFNILPVPPLDGSRLLTAFLPDRIYYRIMRYERYIQIVILALLFLGILLPVITFLSGLVLDGLSWLVNLPF